MYNCYEKNNSRSHYTIAGHHLASAKAREQPYVQSWPSSSGIGRPALRKPHGSIRLAIPISWSMPQVACPSTGLTRRPRASTAHGTMKVVSPTSRRAHLPSTVAPSTSRASHTSSITTASPLAATVSVAPPPSVSLSAWRTDAFQRLISAWRNNSSTLFDFCLSSSYYR